MSGRLKKKAKGVKRMINAKYKEYYENRELSWLKFNQRVLEEAEDITVPLCERLSFVSIFQSNLDEFFMVRAGSLYDQMLSGNEERDNKSKMTAKEQLNAIYPAARKLCLKKDEIFQEIMSEIAKSGTRLMSFQELDNDEKEYLEKYFEKTVQPVLSPQVIGRKQPFPFLKNREIYAVALIGSKNSEKLAVVPCSNGILPRLVKVNEEEGRYMLMEELILHFLPNVFLHYTVKSKSLIRIVRNADIDVDSAFYDEDIDYRNAMQELIKERKRLAPVKLDYSRLMDEKIILSLCKELDIKLDAVFLSDAPLDMGFIGDIRDNLRNHKEFFYKKRVPLVSPQVKSGVPMIEQVEEKDMLFSYPYQSMTPFIRLIREASEDSRVISIKMSLYRVASSSQIVEALIDAAENGKEVVVVVELRARFDEENNIEWSRRLERAGCRLVYGIDYIKVHSKLCLITYKDTDGLKHITQVGTGNYNEKTAKLYTDLSIMTADENISNEVNIVFNQLCMADVVEDTEHLLVAPKAMQSKIIHFIDEEIEFAKNGKPAYLAFKLNSLTDKKIMDKLIDASQAGVKIEMVIRGICCLIPEVKDFTENIRIISIVGRYLEHSRIYIFGAEERTKVYISSADFMTRNMEKRVEVAIPVYSEDIKNKILESFSLMMRDNVKARELKSDGYYHRLSPAEGEEAINSQEMQ